MIQNTVVKLTKPYKKLNSISEFKSIHALTLENVHYTGACIQVRETGKNSVKDIYFTSNGKLDKNSLLDHCDGNDGLVSKIYDQMEFSDAVQTIVQRQPKIVDLGTIEMINGEPCIKFDNFNDYLEFDTPFADDESVVSVMCLHAESATGTSVIMGMNSSSAGLFIYNQINLTKVQTKRSISSIATNPNPIILNEVILQSCVANRTDLKLYNNDQLVDTSSDSNTNFVSSVKMKIGVYSTSSFASGMRWQLSAVSLNDESNNIAEYYKQLSIRYDSSLTNLDDEIWFSNSPVFLSPSRGVSNGRLVGDINFTENIKVFAWESINQGGFGNIDIINIDNKFDEIVSDGYDEIIIYDTNDPSQPFGSGNIENIGFVEKGRIRISIKSSIDKLKVPIPTENFDVTTPDLENVKKPILLGKCSLVSPFLIDSSINDYYCFDNIAEVTQVFDNAIPVLFTQTQNGFTLIQNPSNNSKITFDGTGYNSFGVDEQYINQHIPRLLKNIEINFSQSELHSIYPNIECSYYSSDSTVLDAINELLDGFLSYMYADSAGKLRFGTLSQPTSADHILYEHEIIEEIKVFNDESKNISETMQNKRYWSPYNEGQIAYGAIQARKIHFVNDYRYTMMSSGLHPFYKFKNVIMKSLSIGASANGQVILDDITNLWSQVRNFYSFSCARKFNLNDSVSIITDIKGLNPNKLLLVISKQKSTNSKKTKYTLWG